MKYVKNCPQCSNTIEFTCKGNLNRSIRNNKVCKSCAQENLKKSSTYSDRNKKISEGRIEYFNNLSESEHNLQKDKMSNSISEKYKNRSNEWKNNWKEICSITTSKRWEDPEYKKRVSNTMKDNNWSKREDSKEIYQKSIDTKIQKYGKSSGHGKCKYYKVDEVICYGLSEKKYIDYLYSNNLELPKNTNAIKTPIGYYTPDFEFEDFFIEVKSTFTFNVLIGIQSYSKTKKSNPLQLEKIKWISDNIKPIKIFIVDNNVIEEVNYDRIR